MAYNLTKCDYCVCRFKVKRVFKPWIGYYKGKPTYHWHYVCPRCVKVNTIRYWNDHINPVYDKWVDLGIKVSLNKRDPNYDQIVKEFVSTRVELDKIYEDLETQLL